MNNNELPVTPIETVSATKCMVFGILAIALCGSGILGIIFGAIALSFCRTYAREHAGVLAGQAKVGKILGMIGLILGIVLTVFWVFYVIFIVALIGELASNPGFSQEFFEFEDIINEMMALPRFVF